MDNELIGVIFSFILGALFGAIIGAVTVQKQAGLDECQQKLTREQYCVMVAVPESEVTR